MTNERCVIPRAAGFVRPNAVAFTSIIDIIIIGLDVFVDVEFLWFMSNHEKYF